MISIGEGIVAFSICALTGFVVFLTKDTQYLWLLLLLLGV